jgi:hypothetical protein
VNVARHNTYINQTTRKERSHEQIKADGGLNDESSTSLVEVESGVFIDSKQVKDLINPTEEELFKLAGGNLDMINLGKKGIDLRTVLATRVSKRVLFLVFLNSCLGTPHQAKTV